MLNIVIPMAGEGKKFQEAGYAFPKPLIDIHGQTMIELVVKNLTPSVPHKFIFICRKDHYDSYDLHNVFKNATDNNFEVVTSFGNIQGAAPTVLLATSFINNEEELIIANSDQYVEEKIDDFVARAREGGKDGLIMTFPASHPKWSYARTDSEGKVLETAEKKVISKNATVGVYYFRKGSDFVRAAQAMIHKDIKHNDQFYVCPSFNELILEGKNIYIYPIEQEKMHGLGTPEELQAFLQKPLP
jgi:NDP-sugar pyrophosphorylase family protein